MPPGKVHTLIYIDKGWIIVPPLLVIAVLFFVFPSLWWVYLWFGIFIGYMPFGLIIDPDADQTGVTKSEGRILALDNKPLFYTKKYRKQLRKKHQTRWKIILNIMVLFFWSSVTLILQLFIWAWLCVWLGYSILFPHRSFLSHSYVVSTLVRVLYFWFFVGLLTASFGDQEQVTIWMSLLLHPFGIGITIGLGLADTLHIMADYGRIDLTKYKE